MDKQAAMEMDCIDTLLERYLHLLDQYTSIRRELGNLQTGTYQNLARANFSAERGMRFGQDFYDERMQASRLLSISVDDQGVPTFTLAKEEKELETVPSPGTDEQISETKEGDGVDDDEAAAAAGADEVPPTTAHAQQDNKSAQKPKSRDPLQWFGLLTPMPLRQAQGQSIHLVEQVIPKLVSINAEMSQVEIQVRRARKKRAKADAAAGKEKENQPGKEILA
jgi:coiled-coil domain-containing protein 115